MSNILLNIWLSLLAGLFAPIGAVCVLPLYPGFIAYLANQNKQKESEDEEQPDQEPIKVSTIGWIVSLGVVSSMFLVGLIFTTIFKASLTNAIGIISPIAFGILAIFSLFLIFNIDIGRFFPKVNAPFSNRPFLRAYLFGFFFGAIVLPCNPASLVVVFALSTSTVGFLANLLNFLVFGLGMAAPLILLAYLSTVANQAIIKFFTKWHKVINVIAGLILLVISLYYLLFVFKIVDFDREQPIESTEIQEQASEQIETSEEQKEELSPEVKITNEGVKYIIDPTNLLSGGPPKDGIPSIDNPKYVSVSEADQWIKDNELILALIYKDTKRVYPLQIMVWHEIVNDTIEGDPILITYCPLCGSGIAYERVIDGESVEFGVSGKLYNSNLVMYDRKTDTYWTQIDGVAIIGELVTQELTAINIDTVVWRDWKKAHPDSEVLSQETGHDRDYGRDPYGSYYEDSFIFFPVDHEDNRIHPKTVIFGIEVNGAYKAYREEDIDEIGIIEDEFQGLKLEIQKGADGITTITNKETGEVIVKERDFWFAWYAFHPDTELYLP